MLKLGVEHEQWRFSSGSTSARRTRMGRLSSRQFDQEVAEAVSASNSLTVFFPMAPLARERDGSSMAARLPQREPRQGQSDTRQYGALAVAAARPRRST